MLFIHTDLSLNNLFIPYCWWRWLWGFRRILGFFEISVKDIIFSFTIFASFHPAWKLKKDSKSMFKSTFLNSINLGAGEDGWEDSFLLLLSGMSSSQMTSDFLFPSWPKYYVEFESSLRETQKYYFFNDVAQRWCDSIGWTGIICWSHSFIQHHF